MSSVRTFVSFAGALAAVVALAGCYDLSAPDGPSREDFIRNRTSSTAAASGEQAPPQPSCTQAACPAEAPPTALRTLEPAPPDGADDEIDATATAKPTGGSIPVR